MTTAALIYFALVNLLATIVFVSDKVKAQTKKRRVPEKDMHILEFLGGVFSIMLLMYVIRHKNRKKEYFLLTWFIFALWGVAIYFVNTTGIVEA